jgi:hypothetical protein
MGTRNSEQGRAGERRQACQYGPVGQAESTGAKLIHSASDLRGLRVLLCKRLGRTLTLEFHQSYLQEGAEIAEV